MTDTPVKLCGALLLWSAVVWLLTSFVGWDLWPGNWEMTGRFFAAMFWLAGAVMVVMCGPSGKYWEGR